MFWRFGGYANVSAIDTLLEKQDVELTELLDESDLIQELKQHNTKLIEYLRDEKILERLLEYVVAPKPDVSAATVEKVEDNLESEELNGKDRSLSRPREPHQEEEDEKKRNRYAYVAAEILSSDNWSICEALMECKGLRKFWNFLMLPAPLDPLQASYFTKVNEALLDRKTEEMLELFKSVDGAVKSMLRHVDSAQIMDCLLKIISLEKAEGGQGIVDWLHSQDLMPILLSFLSSEHSWATQTSAGDFLKAIITISANASQNEQSCIGPNELTRQLVSEKCVEKLIADMLKGGNPLTVGVGIVIEVIRKNNSDYDPDVGAEANAVPTSRDPIYLGTLLRKFAQRVPDFMELILSPNHTIGGGDGPVTIKRKELNAAFGGKIEPLGFDRFKTCELMAELLHCSNMGLLNERGSEEFVKARDAEREQLKAEGKLGIIPNQASLLDDDLTMKSSTQTRLGSPDGSRKLEVQNASDDDGFEEVTHIADLSDDSKNDFDEKPDVEDLLASMKPVPLSFMDKDDDEFVDEPLSSPRLQNVELERPQSPIKQDVPPQLLSREPLDAELIPQPLSPTKELARGVNSLDVKDEDIHMTSPPPSEPLISNGEHSKESPNDEKSISTSASEDIPVTIAEQKAAIVEEITAEDVATLPHPEDKPAPLFALKEENESLSSDAPKETGSIESSQGTESLDTTMGEAGDSSNSVMMGNTEEHHQSLTDDTERPVVGDYLKMQFVEHKVVPTILDFFFRFPWNNFLHNVVYDVVQQVFNGPMDRGFNRSLAIDLFDTGHITMRIVDGQKKSDEAQTKNKMRLGYMGHLTLIAEEVVKFTERHPPELLSESVMEKVMNDEWMNYVEITLAETRERDNAILGGVRPDMSVNPRQAVMNAVNAANNFTGSSALAEAGLNGNGLDSIDLAAGNGASGGSFTLTGGTLLSGFGSSSDEEDDEMDEDNDEDGSRNSGSAEVGPSCPLAPNLDRHDDEEVDFDYLEQLDRENPLFSEGDFLRYISNPSTTTATSSLDLEPPSAPPPPPPPLNIPPSRARRQLAARLALHSKQNLEANSTNGDEPEKIEHCKNPNPFAADEDDDSDEEGDFTIGDLEAEEEGKGHLPPGTGLVGSEESLLHADKNVGSLPSPGPSSPSIVSSTSFLGISAVEAKARQSFPSLWPFGGVFWPHGDAQRGDVWAEDDLDYDRKHFREKGAFADDDTQSSDDDSDDEYGGGFGNGQGGRRRLSATTEAKRRTSLEDDDEDEVVHVRMAEAASEGGEGKLVGEGDEEIVEIQHTEVKGESEAKK